ncbi:AAA family ATPase [Deinococcus hopiensis]|uniref:ATPase AAA-type core domain-containing protein n=1 Tax=Deinococcus hopiensis KR-140 TaxID=695939 RepID=A0A1W1VK40_9DEIO|nr:ATP-binding protein [Deinococcus hopiensis]SMB93304.1 hypothetical protein SAMN00790413_01925 [Deinococcus hopiensis KR-140]
MVIQFSVRNFRSIRGLATLDFVASKIKSRDPRIDVNNVVDLGKIKILKSIAIYGANASGKSNIFKALEFMGKLITFDSTRSQIGDPIKVEPFMLDETGRKETSLFELIFIIDDIKYRYGFEVNDKEVMEEWLYWTPKNHERKIFYRDSGSISHGTDFYDANQIKRFVRNNALFLPIAAQFNAEIPKNVLQFFRRLFFLRGSDKAIRGLSVRFLEQGMMKDEIQDVLRAADLHIEDFALGEKWNDVDEEEGDEEETSVKQFRMASNRKIITIHHKYNDEGEVVGTESFDLEKNESSGTQKIFALSGLLIAALKSGGILFVDEVDSQLHPLITKSLIKMFNSQERNPNGAQLVFITHDTSLLDSKILRRDQIWFAEKDKIGSTEIYSLADYEGDGKKIRNDASFEKDYISGRYGAIPYLGAFDFNTTKKAIKND